MQSVEQHIASLEAMSSLELRETWRRLTASPLPRVSPSLLRLALAWEIQARALGGLSPRDHPHARSARRRQVQDRRCLARHAAGARVAGQREWAC